MSLKYDLNLFIRICNNETFQYFVLDSLFFYLFFCFLLVAYASQDDIIVCVICRLFCLGLYIFFNLNDVIIYFTKLKIILVIFFKSMFLIY